MRDDLPTGTVTFLFTDVEGSTRLLHELGARRYAEELAEHRRVLRAAYGAHGGVEVDTQGDAFFFAFPTAQGALDAARDGQRSLANGPIRVRVGLHTGTPLLTDDGYVGEDVHKGARIGAAGHGGQVVLSKETRELVDGRLTDLGEHRLKDFTDPVWIFQLGSEHFPPLKTISNTNLPSVASSFIGREREVAEIVAMVGDGTRLVTLAGPGGSGKTRLAIEAATALVPEFRNGVFWVGLAPLRDPTLVISTIAQTLGAKESLAEHIGEREMLLVLDNLEQVVECAPELASLQEVCPNMRLLVTSRELLRVSGEVGYSVPPLDEPEAVALFCERARSEPDGLVAELCARLDNLPLAVELAAARTRALSTSQILERITQRLDLFEGGRDADPRQRTLRTTIAWSYDLLAPDERLLFARLSVFSGGCTLDAAEQVAGADLDTLQSLVEKSLLRFANERYWMLETIRGFATERLGDSDEEGDLRRRHAMWFLALAEEAEPFLRRESLEWLDRLEPDHDNVRAALDHLHANEAHELALQLVASFWWFWSLRGHIAEGRRRVERALSGDGRPTAARAMALTGAADLAGDDDDWVAVRQRAEEALVLHRALGDEWGTAYDLLALGLAANMAGDWPSGRTHLEQSVRTFERLGDEHWALQAMRRLAWSSGELAGRDEERALQTEIVRRARALGDRFVESKSLGVLAQLELDEGRVDGAVVSMLEEAHRFHRDRPTHPDLYADAILMCRFARALALRDRPAAAVQLLSCSDALLEGSGMTQEAWVARLNDATLALIADRLDDVAVAEAHRLGRALTADEAVSLALAELGR